MIKQRKTYFEKLDDKILNKMFNQLNDVEYGITKLPFHMMKKGL